MWLNTTSAVDVFQADVKVDRFRFFFVYGLVRSIVGISESVYDNEKVYQRCYANVKLTLIKGTSDGIESDEHIRLVELARNFAGQYNKLMRSHLDRISGKTCELR